PGGAPGRGSGGGEPRAAAMTLTSPAAGAGLCETALASSTAPTTIPAYTNVVRIESPLLPCLLRIEDARVARALDLVDAGVAAPDEIHAWVRHAEPHALVLEMVPEMVLLDPAAEPRLRHERDVRDVVHPFVVEQAEDRAEQHRRAGAEVARDREEDRERQRRDRDDEPHRQEQQVQL